MSDARTLKAVTTRLVGLPPDLDGINHKRAGWADVGLNAFAAETGTDPEDVVADFIADVMHWCDRNGTDFQNELERAQRMYATEIVPE